MVKLDPNDIELINKIYRLQNLNEYEYNPEEIISKLVNKLEDDDLIIDLMDFIDDKKIEYGFNNDYSVNDLGAELTKLWDKIYYQHND